MIHTTTVMTTYEIGDDKGAMTVEVTPKHIMLYNEQKKRAFIFRSSNTKETRARWRNVAKLITKACDLV